jgi:hypothetical protein
MHEMSEYAPKTQVPANASARTTSGCEQRTATNDGYASVAPTAACSMLP